MLKILDSVFLHNTKPSRVNSKVQSFFVKKLTERLLGLSYNPCSWHDYVFEALYNDRLRRACLRNSLRLLLFFVRAIWKGLFSVICVITLAQLKGVIVGLEGIRRLDLVQLWRGGEGRVNTGFTDFWDHSIFCWLGGVFWLFRNLLKALVKVES